MLELHIMDSYQMLFPTSSSSPSTSVFPFSHSVETSHADYYNKNSTNLDCSGDRNERPFGVRDELSSLVGNLAVPQNEEKLAAKMKQGEKKKMRKPRYAFQTRSQVDILDDGYRWRKYGQKAVKNNKFPRSYYRCTYQGCNVKKQVQRLTKDEGVVVTTYEGVHTHSIDKPTDNFEHILNQMRIYTPFQGSYATEITRRMHGN